MLLPNSFALNGNTMTVIVGLPDAAVKESRDRVYLLCLPNP